jgi:beta-N-acetylhexosaminidase
MRRRAFPGVDYRQDPRWAQALSALRAAQLVE